MKNYDQFTDEELLKRMKNGENDIMDYLLVKYKPLVIQKAKALFLLGGDNDDLIQEGMIGLMKAIRDYEPDKKSGFIHFAYICILRQMYSAIKSAMRKKHSPLNSYVSIYEEQTQGDEIILPLVDTMPSETDNNPEALFLEKEVEEIITNNFRKELSKLEKQVFDLYLTGLDYRKIAEKLDKSPKSIDNALQRIRTKAQKLL